MVSRISTLVARAGSSVAIAPLLVAGLAVSHANLGPNLGQGTASPQANRPTSHAVAGVQGSYTLAAAVSEVSRNADVTHGLGGS